MLGELFHLLSRLFLRAASFFFLVCKLLCSLLLDLAKFIDDLGRKHAVFELELEESTNEFTIGGRKVRCKMRNQSHSKLRKVLRARFRDSVVNLLDNTLQAPFGNFDLLVAHNIELLICKCTHKLQ